MALVTIPINKMYSNVDDSINTQNSELLMDCYIDEFGSINKRPGLNFKKDLNTGHPIKGLYWWEEQKKVVAVSNGRIFLITDSSGAYTDITGDALTGLYTPTFASFTGGSELIIADGGRMVRYTGTGQTSYVADADAPTRVTHVIFFDQRILANDVDTQNVYFSDVGTTTSWSASNFFVSESRADVVKALHESWREINTFGETTIETFFDKGTSADPFVRFEGAYIERGLGATYSVASVNNTWMFLDNTRRVVMVEGRTPKIVSLPIDREMQSFSDVSDAIGFNVEVGGKTFYVLTLNSAGKTYAYDYALQSWYEWSKYNTTTAQHERWHGESYCYARTFGTRFVGDRTTSNLYALETDTYEDNDSVIRSLVLSGNINHGTLNNKVSRRLRVRARRGDGENGGASQFKIRWRDNGNSSFNEPRILSLGNIGDSEFYIDLVGMGMYRSRQYEIVHNDDSPFVIVSMEEDVEPIMI